MRFVVHVSLPTDKFNKAIYDGTIGEKMGRVLEEMKPEAAFFTAKDGKRGGYFVVNINDPSEMPRIAEPFFLMFDGAVEFLPAMTPQELQKSGLDQLAKKWK
ncbi:MAG TPA: panthothenate synthetase [Candidatus Krumholzibacteria bacterium]|nr:panthothenate synthetase [Candidatus Krumholzibacteria bacterium]